MTKELSELITGKKIFVYTLANGMRIMGELIETDHDLRTATLLSALELIWEVDDEGQDSYQLVPMVPLNQKEFTTIYFTQVVSVTTASDLLKKAYWRKVTSESIIAKLSSGDIRLVDDSDLMEHPPRSGRRRPVSSGQKESIQRDPLDLESMSPLEVGLNDFDGSNGIWRTIMKNFPYRDWKIG